MINRYKEQINAVCSTPHEVFFFEETDSTNLRAAEYIKEKKARGGEVFIARRQSAGRGTRQRSFYSEGGLYMSLILKAEDACENLTPFAAVCVCRAIDSLFGTRCGIKWVNDVILGGKKLCGILCESCFTSNGLSSGYVIVGIGINTGVTFFPSELSGIATSLCLCGHKACDNALIAARILHEFEHGGIPFMDEYRSRSVILGRDVEVSGADGGKKRGIAVSIGDDGSLTIETDRGTERITYGDVFPI